MARGARHMPEIPSAESIASQLFRAAETRAWQHGLHFDADVSSKMEGMANYGADNILGIASERSEDWQKERYARAVTRVGSESMAVFVDEMARRRLESPDYIKRHGPELRIEIWTEVRELLCPIWLIC
jgi:hypothetical protein